MIAMARNLRKRLSVVVATTIATVVTTIYLKNGAIFQDFPSNFLMVYCLEISKQYLITKVSWIRLVATPSRSKGLNRILDLFKRLKVIHKPTRFDK
jgi:Tfp pilus assembly protein PilZ